MLIASHTRSIFLREQTSDHARARCDRAGWGGAVLCLRTAAGTLDDRCAAAAFTLCPALSLVLCVVTVLLWLAYVVERKFYIRLSEGRVRLGPYVQITAGRESGATPAAVYGVQVEDAWPRVTGPRYLTPQYMMWEKQFRHRDRRLGFLGLRCWRWASISSFEERTEFRGYWYGVEIPYWFVSSVTAVLPLSWFVRRQRRRRWLARGGCPACGYDLRASPARCPECGLATDQRGPSAARS